MNRPLRVALALALVVLTPVVGTFALRTAFAAWLVFPSPVVWMPSPTRNLATVQSAANLAPGEASYASYAAEIMGGEARTIGTGPAALEHAEDAWAESERAVALQPTNPGFRLLSGNLALTRALLRRSWRRPA